MGNAFGQFVARSKTDNPKTLNEEIQKMNNQQPQPFPATMISEEEEVDHMIHHGINNLLETHSSHSQEIKPNISTHHSSQASIERINPNLRIKETENFSSSILRFELKRDLKIRQIYNLFSNFGNISYISKKTGRAYIKFRTLEFAAIARTYLHERYLSGNLLVLSYPEVVEEGLPKEGEYCECIFYDKSFDRYKLFYLGLLLIDL